MKTEVVEGWNLIGLEGVEVNMLETDEGGLLVGTDQGLYR